MLVPLFIPSAGAGMSGELVVFPNRRPFRRSAIVNVFEKVFAQNRFYRKRIIRNFNRAPEKYSVQLIPGNVYLFWGYRTLHGNLRCAVVAAVRRPLTRRSNGNRSCHTSSRVPMTDVRVTKGPDLT
jgi:hypothetical protein